MLIINKKYESLHDIFEAGVKVGAIRNLLETAFKSVINSSESFPKAYKSGEVLRANFGDNDSSFIDGCYNVLKNALKVNKKDVSLNVTRNKNISGTFNVCEVQFNKDIPDYNIHAGDILYITNRTTAVSDKQLSPQSLGITGVFNKQSLLKEIKNGLDTSSSIPDSLKTSLWFICKQIASKTDETIDLDDMILHGTKKVLNYNLPSKEIDLDAFKNSLNAIAKDFGEVIGGVFLLNYMADAKSVAYSDSYTDAMIDYQIICKDNTTLGVSAKIESGGHTPSSSALLNKMKNFVTSGAEINGMTFDELLANSYVQSPDSVAKAKEFFEILMSTNDMSTKAQYITLIDKFCSDNKAVNDFCNLFGFSKFYDLLTKCGDKTLESNFAKIFDNICSDSKSYKKLVTLCSNLKKDCGFASTISFDSPDDAIALKNIYKIGMFVYPFSQLAVKTINDNFGLSKSNSKKIDIISAFIRLAFSHKQIYTKIQILSENKLTIVFSFAAMDTGDWQFKCPTSSKEPWMQKVAIKLVH